MKNKKLIIGIVIAVIILGVALFFGYRFVQEQILIDEANKISSQDLLTTEIDMTIKTTGNYAVVEQTMKDYLKNVQDVMSKLKNTYEDETIINALTPENLKNDGPEFETTKSAVTKAREDVTNYANETTKFLDEENILSKIQDKNLSDYYVGIYKKIMYEDEQTMADMENAQKELNDANTKYLEMLDKIDQVITLLSENPNAWNVTDDGQVEFSSQSVLDQYNAYVTEIQAMGEEQ